MPTYEYKCEKCGYTFDAFQSISAQPLKKCRKRKCGGNVHRIISPGAGFLFKGSGFYCTDYRSDSYKKASDAEKTKSGDSKTQSSSSEKKTSETSNKTVKND